MVCLNLLVSVHKLLHIMGKMSRNSSMHEPCTDCTADCTSCIQVILQLLYLFNKALQLYIRTFWLDFRSRTLYCMHLRTILCVYWMAQNILDKFQEILKKKVMMWSCCLHNIRKHFPSLSIGVGYVGGTWWCSLLRHCATQQIMVLIPD
jgi:hypothetical protein